jgi:hypothetical protein
MLEIGEGSHSLNNFIKDIKSFQLFNTLGGDLLLKRFIAPYGFCTFKNHGAGPGSRRKRAVAGPCAAQMREAVRNRVILNPTCPRFLDIRLKNKGIVSP